MGIKNGSHIQSILDDVHEKRRELMEEAENHLKKFMEDHDLTLFDFLIGYEVKTEYGNLPTIFDDFDLDSNEYKYQLTLETHIRKRTPEESEALLKSLYPLFSCECGHYYTVHILGSEKKCLEPKCDCAEFEHEKVKTDEDSNNRES